MPHRTLRSIMNKTTILPDRHPLSHCDPQISKRACTDPHRKVWFTRFPSGSVLWHPPPSPGQAHPETQCHKTRWLSQEEEAMAPTQALPLTARPDQLGRSGSLPDLSVLLPSSWRQDDFQRLRRMLYNFTFPKEWVSGKTSPTHMVGPEGIHTFRKQFETNRIF